MISNSHPMDLTFDFGEDVDLEAKAAQGRDGNGEVPDSVWETYSAMANTYGGVIMLGIEEKTWRPIGIKNISTVRKSFWDQVNNKQRVSCNLLVSSDVYVWTTNQNEILCIRVPRASRNQRPVYRGSNPLTGTYRR